MGCNLAQASATRKKAKGALELEKIFRTVTATTCPRFYNFHMHTVCSDGQLEPENLMQQALDLDLWGLAITDHHSLEGYRRALRWYEDWQWRNPCSTAIGVAAKRKMKLWPGVEINTGLLDIEVHMLGYGFNPDHEALQPYLQRHGVPRHSSLYQAPAVIAAIQAAGGFAVLAHPARYRQPADALIMRAADFKVDGVEAFYAYDNPSPWRPSPPQTEQILTLARQFGLLTTGGTDTHGRSLLRRI